MSMQRTFFKLGMVFLGAMVVAACSSKNKKPEPAPLPKFVPLLSVQQVWNTKVGDIGFPMIPAVIGQKIAVASDNGTVKMLDTKTGTTLWQGNAKGHLTSGVGSDGRVTVVTTRDNEMVAFDEQGAILWRRKVVSQVLTPPLVSGGRVFLNATDRSVQAYDAQNGAGLWRQQQNIMDSLALRRDGMLKVYRGTLIAGLSANIYSINPDNGVPLWGLPIGNPRGANEIDRLADVVGGAAVQGDIICARSYQQAISCIRAGDDVLWTKESKGDLGVAADEQKLYTVEADGTIAALDLHTGEAVWSNTDYRYRQLTGPLTLGARTLVIGDQDGYVHLISREDGQTIGRFSTNSSGVAATPLAVGDMLVLVTKNGTVYGFQPTF